MKGILLRARKFLREETVYGYLLVAVLLTYAFIFAFVDRGEVRESAAVTKLKQVERSLKDEGNQREALERILTENPKKAAALSFFFVGLLLVILFGAALDLAVLSAAFGKKSPIPALREVSAAWSGRDVAKIVILFFTVGIGSNFVLALLKSAFFRDWEENSLLLFHTTFADFFLLAAIIYFVVKKHGGTLGDLGLCFKAWKKDLSLGLLGYVGTLPLFALVLLVLVGISALLSYEPPPHPLVEVFLEEDRRNPLLIAYSLVLACVFGPIVEEVFFRGFAYPVLKKFCGARWAMVATSAVFALTHNSSFAFWPIFVLGLVLVYLYEKRGSLVPSIVLHVTHNSLFIFIFFAMKRSVLDLYL